MTLSPFHDTILMIWNSRRNFEHLVGKERNQLNLLWTKASDSSRERELKPCLYSAELRIEWAVIVQYIDLEVMIDCSMKSMLRVQQQQKSQQFLGLSGLKCAL